MATATKPVLLDETGKQMVAALQGISAAMNVKSVKDILDSVGISHNGIYREKFLGTFNSTAEFEKFLADHKVSSGLFEDLYVGDYFTLNDGTYNKQWEIAGFDTHLNYGDTALTTHHLALVSRTILFTAQMNPTNTTVGAYKGSEMYNTVIPQIDANMTKILGSHLLSYRRWLTTTMNAELDSAAGAGWKGSVTGGEWTTVKACLMNEAQVYGSTVYSSAGYDNGDDGYQLPLFFFRKHNVRDRQWFWLRSVLSATGFCVASNSGHCSSYGGASNSGGVRPIILVG